MLYPSGLGKLPTCTCYILEIINSTSCSTWLFSNKYVCEHNFLLSWVCEEPLIVS